jgi:hypothetical protein
MDAWYEKLRETSHGGLRLEAEARTSAVGKDRTRYGTFSRIDLAGAISPMAPLVDLVSPPGTPAGRRLSCPTASLPAAGRFPRPSATHG